MVFIEAKVAGARGFEPHKNGRFLNSLIGVGLKVLTEHSAAIDTTTAADKPVLAPSRHGQSSSES